MSKHNWKPETMDKCREVFLDQLTNYYWNHTGSFRKVKIYQLIKQYSEINNAVTKNEN